jgi:hypothetical protein
MLTRMGKAAVSQFTMRRFLTVVATVVVIFTAGVVRPGSTAGAQVIDPPRVSPELLAKATDAGAVRVLVTLDGDFQSEGSLPSAAAVGLQRAALATAQANVVGGLAGTAFDVIHTYNTVPLLALNVSLEALAALAASDEVLRVQEDELSAPSLDQSVPWIGLPYLTDPLPTGAPPDLQAGGPTYQGAFVSIAILDTGVMKTHQFFGGRVESEACYSSTGSTSNGTYQSLCPGGVTTGTTTPGSGVNCVGIGGCDHGTHVAGIAAGSNFTGVPFSGVARHANIIAIQVFSRFNSIVDCGGTAPCVLSFTSDQIRGLERVYELRDTYNIASANMSLGGGLTSVNCDSDSRKAIIDNLRSTGIITAIAAGNNGSMSQISFPACISTSFSVGSTLDNADTVSFFSNAASIMDVWAPGSNITSSVTTSATALGVKNGTSMATPHVAGALALLKEKRPYATADELETALRDSGLPVTDMRGDVDLPVTKNRIQFPNALDAIPPSVEIQSLETDVLPVDATVLSLSARVWNRGSVALPATARVLFWVDGFGYVGSTSVSALAANTNTLFEFPWTLPASLPDPLTYHARVWDDAKTGFWLGQWRGPEKINIPPNSPTALMATTVSQTRIDVSWTNNAGEETEFDIERAPAGSGAWSPIAMVGPGLTTHQDTSVTCSAGYDYRVRAYRPGDGRYSGYSNTASANAIRCPPGTHATAPGDFDGDGKSDITVFRPSTGAWYVRGSSVSATYMWGGGSDIPVAGDYDGDGKTDIAVYRPLTGVWYIVKSSSSIGTVYAWGGGKDIPVAADYDGDGKTDIAVFRPSTGVWYIVKSSSSIGTVYVWGGGKDIPVPADYDGDGKADIAVFRPSTGVWYIVKSSSSWGTIYAWGGGGDTPVPGDYDGDGKTDIAVFRPSTGVWYVRGISTIGWGGGEYIPVPGDYDGDGKTDIAVFRPSTGTWYITTLGSAINWGAAGDIPLLRRP